MSMEKKKRNRPTCRKKHRKKTVDKIIIVINSHIKSSIVSAIFCFLSPLSLLQLSTKHLFRSVFFLLCRTISSIVCANSKESDFVGSFFIGEFYSVAELIQTRILLFWMHRNEQYIVLSHLYAQKSKKSVSINAQKKWWNVKCFDWKSTLHKKKSEVKRQTRRVRNVNWVCGTVGNGKRLNGFRKTPKK